MLSSWAAALKLSCSATARKERSWCRVSPLSRASASAIAGTTIGHVTAEPAGCGPKITAPGPGGSSNPARPPWPACAGLLARAVGPAGFSPRPSFVPEGPAGELGFSPLLADFVFAASTAGTADFQAADEAGCWLSVRGLLSYLPAHSGEAPP